MHGFVLARAAAAADKDAVHFADMIDAPHETGASFTMMPRAVPLAPQGLSGDLDVVGIVLMVTLLIVSLAIHEAAHAWVAWKCGDSTAKDLGRVTLNPIKSIDPFMTVLLPGILLYSTGGRFLFGGAKPVPVNFHRLRKPWRDMTLVAAAGPLSNLCLAILFLAAWRLFMTTGWYRGAAEFTDARRYDFLPSVLSTVASANVMLTVFNLLPIAPLDGSRIMAWLLPQNLRESYVSLERFGMLIVFGLIFFGPFSMFLGRAQFWLLHELDKLVSLGGVW